MTRGKARFIYLQLQLHCNLSRVRRLPQGSLLHEPVTLSPVFCPNERLPFLNFQKARWDDFAFYFNYHCSSAEEYFCITFLCSCSLYFSDTECPPYDLVLWTDGSVSFPFDKDGSGVLANCSLCGTEATIFFSVGPSRSSFSAEACAILQALYWSRQHQQVCRLSPPPIWFSLCSLLHLSFYLNLWQELFSFFSCSIRLQWVPGHSFLPANDSADELARRGALLVPSAIPCRLSSLISGIDPYIFSDWRPTVSSEFFDTQVPSISTEELVLLRHAHCVLSRLRGNGHSLLLISYLSRIGRIENPSCSACRHSSQDTSHLILHRPATDSLRRLLFGNFLSLYDLWPRPWRAARFLGPHFSTINPFLGRGRVTTTTAKLKLQTHVYVRKGVSKFKCS